MTGFEIIRKSRTVGSHSSIGTSSTDIDHGFLSLYKDCAKDLRLHKYWRLISATGNPASSQIPKSDGKEEDPSSLNPGQGVLH